MEKEYFSDQFVKIIHFVVTIFIIAIALIRTNSSGRSFVLFLFKFYVYSYEL